jgi:hypothetical protein
MVVAISSQLSSREIPRLVLVVLVDLLLVRVSMLLDVGLEKDETECT